MATSRIMPFLFGVVMSLNFLVFWALPIMGMGGLWKSCIKQFLSPIIMFLDGNPWLRNFAKDYVYTKPEHADFFLTSALIILNSFISLTTVFYWQLSTGEVPYWLIFAYYCSWVGIGGRTMGGAYALAHKEVFRTIIFSVIHKVSKLRFCLHILFFNQSDAKLQTTLPSFMYTLPSHFQLLFRVTITVFIRSGSGTILAISLRIGWACSSATLRTILQHLMYSFTTV